MTILIYQITRYTSMFADCTLTPSHFIVTLRLYCFNNRCQQDYLGKEKSKDTRNSMLFVCSWFWYYHHHDSFQQMHHFIDLVFSFISWENWFMNIRLVVSYWYVVEIHCHQIYHNWSCFFKKYSKEEIKLTIDNLISLTGILIT